MPNKMLEYCKTILQKISFSKTLFKKEYKKTFNYLNEGERVELKRWLRANVSTIVANEKANNRINSEAALVRQNPDNVPLEQKPRIDSITI
jgi:hypothetical protein